MAKLPGIRSVYTSESKDYCRLITAGGSILVWEKDNGEIGLLFKPHKRKQVYQEGETLNSLTIGPCPNHRR